MLFDFTLKTREPDTQRPSGLVSFIRYNISAIIATGVDFLTLIALTELLDLYYVISTVAGAAFGATVAFVLNRNWSFESKNEQKRVQSLKYVLVALGSLALNTFGVFALTEWMGVQYVISKTIAAVIVAVSYNYLLSKYFVFR